MSSIFVLSKRLSNQPVLTSLILSQLFGKQGEDKGDFQTGVCTLSMTKMANRSRHASGPVHSFLSVTCVIKPGLSRVVTKYATHLQDAISL